MTDSHWRKTSRLIINKVKEDNPLATGDELRKLISAAYPFGPRKHHPYKIWLDEVKKAMNTPLANRTSLREFWVK